MADETTEHTLPTLVTDDDGQTVWTKRDWPIEASGGMLLSPRIDCASLRLRRSLPGYTADWHVAGDPTLIVVQAGQLRITLHDGSTRDFGPGDAFIAADNIPANQTFNAALHGHRAEVIGHDELEAIHIKLVKNQS